MQRWLRTICCSAAIAAFLPLYAYAGTTGGVVGRTTDSKSQAPLAGVAITATSASQTASAVTDASGQFRFLSLAPDTYTVTLTKEGYEPVSQPGVSIFADQVQTLNVAMNPALKVIAKTTSRSAGDLLKPGATSDVYSINAAGARAAASLVGPGGLNSAYGAIASVPGVQIDAGEQGWFQTVHIRGGDIDQVGYELDGIPVNRAYDNAPMTMLSSLGQQELQVYTGGTPASSDAQGISGYVNQVVRTGTFPGFAQANLAAGTPAFYHQASVEAGGSTPDRLFSYYVGLGGANQGYRYVDNNNGAGIPNSFFYPVNVVDPATFLPGNNGHVYTGANGLTGLFATGNTFGIGNTDQRDSMLNVHFGIPHKASGLRDDVQLLYLNSVVFAQYYSSQNDIGPDVANQLGQLTWNDSYLYGGSLLQAPVQSDLTPYLFPSSPRQRPLSVSPGPFVALPSATRDVNENGVSVLKAQYQHAFSSNAFLRVYGYLLYSNWFIDGPNTAAQPYYGAELAEYQIPDHTSGVNASLTDQLSAQHLLTASVNYTSSNLQRYDVGFISPNYGITNLVKNGSNNCVNYATDAIESCYGALQGTTLTSLTPQPAPAGAQWLVTNNHFNAALNQVHPRFTGFSISDQWRPSDRLTFNIGARLETFEFLFGDTGSNDPARQFWFTNYNRDFCVANSTSVPFLNGLGPCPAGTQHTNLQNPSVSSYTTSRFQPRIGFTDQLNPLTVLRGSFGIYARPPNSSWVQYNVSQQDLPSYLGSHFYSYGFNTPQHYIRPDTSYNYDLSLEQRLKGTDLTFKLSPFYRATRDQLQNFFIDPQGGLESGLNVGNQESYGVEVAVQKGDFARNGLNGALTYTYTHSRIRYQNFSGTDTNVIDQLNGYIKQYNSYTKTGGGSPCFTVAVSNADGSVTNGSPAACAAGTIVNPYYAAPSQALFDRNAQYPTYDVIPGPFAGANGYAVPNTATLILNYRHDRFAVTPSFAYSSGAEYGSPVVWPGYLPQTCTKTLGVALPSGAFGADPANCFDNGGSLPVFTPDPYTHKFDNLGDLKEPWRLSASLAFEYDISPKAIAHLTFTNLIDHCGQRGYAWDNPNVCVYSTLPSGILAPEGNFYPNSQESVAPPQLRYPYSFWLNNNNTGFVGVAIPLQVTFELQLKL